ncbi:MAG: sulfotransferase [Xenococcaceae cyanobacterium MO_207.B15]|nr:sulfotransferase [Xenococcaceae cyanobacterium MO_207.B15]MDJ0742630.1 sulfotransferase [Xenococcaceae cyanobacterium MO_167.B27]
MEKNLETQLAKAWDLFNKNRAYYKAIAIFKELIEEYPQEIRVYIDGARSALIANELETCKTITQKGLKVFPESLELQSFVIAIIRLEGNVQDALLKVVELQIKHRKLPPSLETERYRAYFQLTQYDKALDSVNKVLLIEPTNSITLRDKLEILINKGDYDEAKDLFKYCLDKNAVLDKTVLFYSELLMKLGDTTEAKKLLKQYHPPLCKHYLARCEIIEGNLESALKIYEEAIENKSINQPWIRYTQSSILQHLDYPKHEIYKHLRQNFLVNHNKQSDHIFLKGIAKLGYGNDALNYMLNLGKVYGKHKKDNHYIWNSIRISYFSRENSLNITDISERLNVFEPQEASQYENNPIIVSGWFRTGTTYTFSLFRSINKHCTPYYEPLHPLIFEAIDKFDVYNQSKLGHELDLGYFHEFQFIDYKSLRMRYLERFEVASSLRYDFASTLPLFDYVNFIIEQTSKDKIPVLQFNRISFILDYFRLYYKNATIISILRNPRDVFSSIVNHFNRSFDTFPFDAPFPMLGNPLELSSGDWEVVDTFSGLLKIFDISLKQDFSFYSKVYVINKTAELFAREFSDAVIEYEELAKQGSTLLTDILLQKGLIEPEIIEKTEFPEPHQKSIGSWRKFADKVDFDAEEAKCTEILQELTAKFSSYVQSFVHIIK